MPNNRGFIANTLDAMERNIYTVIIGAFILGGIGTWSCRIYSTYQQAQAEKARIKAGLELKVGDYNGNQILDKFYEINGQKVPVEVDGKPVAEYFKR